MAGTPKPIGRILIIPKGNYDPSTPYNSLDLVRYDFKSWLCKTDGIIGITPTEGTDWTLMTEDGTDGRGIVDIQRTGTDPSNPLKDIYTITYTDGTTSTFTVTNGSGGGTTADTMLKSVYDKNDDGIVDKADAANTATKATDATNAKNLKKSDGTTISADSINTKLSKLNSDGTLDYSNVKNTPTIPDVSNKIDKPSTANEGQVLTYNGSNWIAEDSGGASSTYNNSVVHPTPINRMKETFYTVDSVTLPKGTYLAIFSGTLYFTEWAEVRFNIKVSNNSIGNDFFEDASQALYARSGNVMGVVSSEQDITFDFRYYANKNFDEYSYSVNIIKL